LNAKQSSATVDGIETRINDKGFIPELIEVAPYFEKYSGAEFCLLVTLKVFFQILIFCINFFTRESFLLRNSENNFRTILSQTLHILNLIFLSIFLIRTKKMLIDHVIIQHNSSDSIVFSEKFISEKVVLFLSIQI
jgi:hypothetical protein